VRFWFLLLLAPMLVKAQLPLSIEELLIDQHVLKLDTSISHATSTQTVQRLDWVTLDRTHSESPIAIPRIARRDSDYTQIVAGLRYGVSRRTELNVRVNNAYFTVTEPPVSGAPSIFNDTGNLQSLTLGANWLASPENDTPALLLSVSLDAIEKSSVEQAESLYGKTGRIGATIYKSIDPVVLSIAMGYEFSSDRELIEQELDPGNEWFVSPQLNFAVNHKVTLIGGIAIHVRQGDEIDGRQVTARKSSTQALLGLGFAPTASSTIFVQSRFNTGGDRSANLSLDWLYQFQ
jgi:hypothetical protein